MPYATLAVLLVDAGGWAKSTLPTCVDRGEFFESVVGGERDPVELLGDGGVRGVRDLIAWARRAYAPA